MMAQEYFAKFRDFDYDSTAPLVDEFQRLAASHQWREGGKVYRKQRQNCFAHTYEQYFSKDQNTLRGWP